MVNNNNHIIYYGAVLKKEQNCQLTSIETEKKERIMMMKENVKTKCEKKHCT